MFYIILRSEIIAEAINKLNNIVQCNEKLKKKKKWKHCSEDSEIKHKERYITYSVQVIFIR